MSENPYRIVECPHCHEEVSVKSFETERRIHLETIERLHREIAALRHATTDEPGLRAAHHQHVHRDGCHRWFDHNANQLIDLAGPAGWCDGCTEDWPCDTTRALNRAALALTPAASDGSLDVERLTEVLRESPLFWEVRRPDGALVMTRMFNSPEEAAEYILARLSESPSEGKTE